MHDDAIERRTKLVLERESEIQEQKLTDERLAKEEEREKTKRAMETSKAEHRARIQRTEFEASQREKAEVAEQQIKIASTERSGERAHFEALQTGLSLSGADMAALLIAHTHTPAKLIQIQGDARPMIHIEPTAE
jgi:hypothetical protein